jgi:hypothetical protein
VATVSPKLTIPFTIGAGAIVGQGNFPELVCRLSYSDAADTSPVCVDVTDKAPSLSISEHPHGGRQRFAAVAHPVGRVAGSSTSTPSRYPATRTASSQSRQSTGRRYPTAGGYHSLGGPSFSEVTVSGRLPLYDSVTGNPHRRLETMALYQVVLCFQDREEVRLTDRPPRVGETVEIAGRRWIVETAVRDRYKCVPLSIGPSDQARGAFAIAEPE